MVDGMTMAGKSLEALDAVVWEGLATGNPVDSVDDVSRALRRLALAISTPAGRRAPRHSYSRVTRQGPVGALPERSGRVLRVGRACGFCSYRIGTHPQMGRSGMTWCA